MTEINKVAPLAAAKLFTVLAVLGVLLNLILTVIIFLISPLEVIPRAEVIFLLLAVAITFFLTYLSAVVYNFLVTKIGGIKINLNQLSVNLEGGLKMIEIKEIDIKSLAKIYAVGMFIFTLVFAIVFLLIGIIQQEAALIGISFIIPIFYGGIAALMGGLLGLIYNFTADKVGGLKLKLVTDEEETFPSE